MSTPRHRSSLEDHVHLLVDVGPQYGIHTFVKQVKGKPSRISCGKNSHGPQPVAELVGQFLFCLNPGMGPACRYQAVHRTAEIYLSMDERPRHPLSAKGPCGQFRRKKTPYRHDLRPRDSSTMPCLARSCCGGSAGRRFTEYAVSQFATPIHGSWIGDHVDAIGQMLTHRDCLAWLQKRGGGAGPSTGPWGDAIHLTLG